MNKFVLLSVAIAIILGGLLWVWLYAARATGASKARLSIDTVEGEHLYQQFCAACHGADLEGQPDWQMPGADDTLPAPPHDETGHAWHHSDQTLFVYSKWGGAEALARQGVTFNSGMPGFADQLSDAEIRSILTFIKSTLSEENRAFPGAQNKP